MTHKKCVLVYFHAVTASKESEALEINCLFVQLLLKSNFEFLALFENLEIFEQRRLALNRNTIQSGAAILIVQIENTFIKFVNLGCKQTLK